MKVSIITICYNEEKNIAKTIKSVLDQTSNDFEYIICDGKSKDNTLQIAYSYVSDFEKKGVSYQIISEKDGGIYYAMNNGIDKASGDYVIFMNSGDQFYDEFVIDDIIEAVKGESPEVIYGDCQAIDRCVSRIISADHKKLCNNMSICHQSILVRTDKIKENKFDTSFKIAADYDMMLSFYLKNYSFFKVDKVISRFSAGGVSSVNIVESVKEACDIKQKHGIECDRELEIKIASKDQRAVKLKRSIPMPLWKFWNKTLKKRQWIEQ